MNTHINFAVKMRNEFENKPGWQFVEWHLTNNMRNELVYRSILYLRRNGCRWSKAEVEKFDLICKRYCWELRRNRTM